MIKRKFETTPGTRQWGYIHLPDDKTKKYPVVIFCHGMGEVGNDEASVTKLLTHGPLYHVNRGWNPNIIIIAIQHHSWSFPYDRIPFVLANDPDVKAMGNGQVMITGLSAGGAIVYEAMIRYNKPNYSFVPMSPAIGAVNNYPAGTYKVWGFVGNNDKTTQGALPGLYDMQSKIGAKVTVYEGGHCCWNAQYDPNRPGGNIYDWAFNSYVPPAQPTTTTSSTTTTTTTPILPPDKVVVGEWNLTFYSDGTLDTVKIN